MKKFRIILSFLLAFVMLVNISTTALASGFVEPDVTSENEVNIITVTDEGIFIHDVFYTPEQFMVLLDSAQEMQVPQTCSATAALVAGTWWIPGVGEVVITAAGAILVAGVAIKAGTWVYETVKAWFATRAFNKSAEDAVNNCNKNKQNHIMNSKHNWNKFNKDPKWTDIAPILVEVLKKGSEKWETGNQYIRTLIYKGETVVVRFIKDAEGLVKYIGTAWCK